jgi:hypothetical protein
MPPACRQVVKAERLRWIILSTIVMLGSETALVNDWNSASVTITGLMRANDAWRRGACQGIPATGCEMETIQAFSLRDGDRSYSAARARLIAAWSTPTARFGILRSS